MLFLGYRGIEFSIFIYYYVGYSFSEFRGEFMIRVLVERVLECFNSVVLGIGDV